MSQDQRGRAFGIPVHPAQYFVVDFLRVPYAESGRRDRVVPFGPLRAEAEIGVSESTSRPQNPRDFPEESRKRRVAMRGLDVDDRVETRVGKRKRLRVTRHEAKCLHAAMTLLAKG